MTYVAINAIMLAAGKSARMGTRNKLLLEWNGEILVWRAMRAARDAGIDDGLIVVTTAADDVCTKLGNLRVRVAANHCDEGIASPTRTGIAAPVPAHPGA